MTEERLKEELRLKLVELAKRLGHDIQTSEHLSSALVDEIDHDIDHLKNSIFPEKQFDSERKAREQLISRVIQLLYDADLETDLVRFVADDGDWYLHPMFASAIEELSNKGLRGAIRLRYRTDDAVDWYDRHNIQYRGKFDSAENLKLMAVGDRVVKIVLKRNGLYYDLETDDPIAVREFVRLYERRDDELIETRSRTLLLQSHPDLS